VTRSIVSSQDPIDNAPDQQCLTVSEQSFMGRLSPADRNALVELARLEKHPHRSMIFREGEPGEALYIVCTGQVAVVKDVGHGWPTVLAYRGPGEIVGEMGVVGNRPRFASVVAIEDSILLRLEAADFQALVTRHPGISRAILDVLNDRLRAADTARMAIAREEQDLTRRVERLTTETERLAELIRLRQETADLIVHDLRSPLSVIDGSLELLQLTLPGEALASSAECLELARRSSQQLLALVHALLEAARQEEPDLPPVREPVELVGLLRAAVDRFQVVAAQRHQVSLMLELPQDLPQPLGDVAQMERVVVNLVDNALAYTPPGGHVTVAATVQGDMVHVSVTDTGPGVPAEYREHIFERFGRVPGADSDPRQGKGRRRGFGLGLYFCRRVAEAHGGRIWVEPGLEGRGSRFVLVLPLAASLSM
jgi:signal transduction histidine kinase